MCYSGDLIGIFLPTVGKKLGKTSLQDVFLCSATAVNMIDFMDLGPSALLFTFFLLLFFVFTDVNMVLSYSTVMKWEHISIFCFPVVSFL
jgi:hypothetical protein